MYDEKSPQGSNPPAQKAPVMLPPEILDKILEHIPTDRDGRPTLIACALVATWWTGPSQRRLFSSVSIYTESHQRWINSVVLPGPKTHLLQYVRSLKHFRSLVPGTTCLMRNLTKDCGGYFSALHNIHSLALSGIKMERTSEEGFRACFSAFRETLTDLTLRLFATSFSMFVTLVDYFPNIATLRLNAFALMPDEGPVPPLSRPLRGELHVRQSDPRCLEFINRLAKLDLEYEGLIFESRISVETKCLKNVLQVSASTVKYLRLDSTIQREHPYRTSLPPHALTWPHTFQTERLQRSVTFNNSESWD